MTSNNDSFLNISIFDTLPDEESVELPIILISLSVAVIIVACVVGIALEIRDKRKQRQRSSSTASTNPLELPTSERLVVVLPTVHTNCSNRSIKETVGKLEEFDNPNYEKTPPTSKKENGDFNWDIVEMEEIDLDDGNTINIVNTLEVGGEVLQRQKSRSCSDLCG